MTMITKLLAGSAGLAALMTAAPAAAQYYGQPYGQAYGYGYANPYGNAYGYRARQAAQMATQQCAAAVQYRLQRQSARGLTGILGAVLGANTMATGRVLGVTSVTPRQSSVRVRGVASSDRGGYGPYGAGAYGALGYAQQPDLTFSCTVDYRGRVRNVDINRRY